MLHREQFYVAMKKCVFMAPKVLFLRYVISGAGLEVKVAKVQAVKE